jgi:hydrogenase maturation protein HypF
MGQDGELNRRRVRARVEGTVQGVGFRPYVYRLAEELRLGGFILNDERGVVLEIEGAPITVDDFLRRLAVEAPPLARVERVASEDIAAIGESTFTIEESQVSGAPAAPVTPDTATCDECLAELFDPADRRYRYPFINCTNCGPRFTIVRGVPYDRPLTTMASFRMCERCLAEYEDPADRRFHAQPNACPDCGPRVWLEADERRLVPEDPIAAAVEALREGRILAVKGIGGFHLACRADDEQAAAVLRSRKHREDKPFALMAPDLERARELVQLSSVDEELMLSHERPIVIAPRRPGAEVAESVAPRSRDLGVMLPYSPLHHLLLRDAGGPLVMTSGNLSDEPIAYRDDDGRDRLSPIADLLLLHDRPIETRTDDSVLRSHSAGIEGLPILMRRSRGFVPESVELPIDAPVPLLACGAELKSTFCVAKGRRAWVSHHIGDLANYETLRSFEQGIEHFERLFAVEPRAVAHDLHPDYLSTRYALEQEGVETIGVQHHHAHLAACLAEHGRTAPALGAIYDGTGYGPDGTIWGGELLVGGLEDFWRIGMLWPVLLPGGDAAIREPWRMACSWLVAAGEEPRPPVPEVLASEVGEERWLQVCELVRTGVSSPRTTSMGRLFDAVAAICGVRARVNYEGQAAAELEAAADSSETGVYPLPVVDADGEGGARLMLDARELFAAVAEEARRGEPVATVAGRFHNAVARSTVAACAAEAERRGLTDVVLSGGVFQNRLLLERTAAELRQKGLTPLIPERLPPNDGGISFGQAAVAAARLGLRA